MRKRLRPRREVLDLTNEVDIPIAYFLSPETEVVQSAHNAEERSAGGLIVRATELASRHLQRQLQ